MLVFSTGNFFLWLFIVNREGKLSVMFYQKDQPTYSSEKNENKFTNSD